SAFVVQAEDGIRDRNVTGVQTCALPILAELDLPGYAIGGLAVGETAQEMYDTIEAVEEHMPKDRPRYLMGVGTPGNIIESVWREIGRASCREARCGRGGRADGRARRRRR